MKKIPDSFYSRSDVVNIARDLLGKIVVTDFDGIITSGRIVETEAYVAHIDKASHAFAGKRTARNEHMYGPAGTAYVYICYGMHHMLNVVTNDKDIPDAILIRAIEPIKGIDTMLLRTGKKTSDFTLTRGPGNVAKALGIVKKHSGISLADNSITFWDDGCFFTESDIASGKRIGVDSAGEDALLPYRFYVRGNKYVSAFNK